MAQTLESSRTSYSLSFSPSREDFGRTSLSFLDNLL